MNDHTFTRSELAKAGPLFNPASALRLDAQHALNAWKLVERVMNKRSELMHELKSAINHAKLCSAQLDHARKTAGMVYYRSVPRRLDPEHGMKVATQQLELDVLSSHDRLWAAQRGVAMWDHVYGSIWS